MSDVKIPFAKVREFMKKYDDDPIYKSARARLGQAFFYEFKDELEKVVDPTLFYTNCYFEAREIIYLKYTEFDQ